MAKIEQQIVLSFQTKLDEAKSDILSLAKLYKESMSTPTGAAGAAGQAGGFSAADKASIEQVVAQRATDAGLSPEELKAVLADINTVLEQEEGIRKRLTDLKEKSLATEEKIKIKEQEKNDLIAKGAQLLGLREGATLKEVAAAKQALDQAVENGTATKEQIALQQQMVGLMGEVSTKNRSLGQLIRHNGELTAEQTTLLADQNNAFDNLRVALRKLNLTAEERSEIESKLVGVLIEQSTQTKVLEAAQKKVAAAAKENAKAQEDINSALKNTPKTFAEKATSAFLYFQAVQAIRRVVRAAVRTLTELDRALTDIAIVTNMSRKETQGLIGTYQEMAKRVGLTTTEVVNLSTAFFRQGRAAADALQLTETAAKFARIAAINVNDAANFLTAAINGFNLAASEANRIIDRFAALGASAAASAQEIAIALSKVAPAAASAGVEIDNLMAFVTKAIETTREAPENIGTAFKTIFARMRELSDIGKVMEDGMDVNRVESALKNIGVDLRDASGEFRNLDQVLIEVGHRWDSISRSQQAYVATTLAGTRQQTRLIALFENFDRTLELITVSQQSAGAAAIQHAEFMQGLEAATTNLKTSFQEFITSIASSDQMLFVIDSLRVGIDLLNTVFGKLILTGLVFKTLAKGMSVDGSKLAGVKTFLTNTIQKLTTSYVTTTKAAYQKATADGVSASEATKAALANTKLGKSYLITKSKISPYILALKSNILALQSKTKQVGLAKTAQILYNKSLTKGSMALFGFKPSIVKLLPLKKKLALLTVGAGKASIFMGKAFVAAGAKILVVMAKLLLSPLALLAVIGGIILALKKMADATDTTNPKVAEWQVRIKKAAEALQNIIQRIKDFFTNLRDGNNLASKFFRAFLNGWKGIFRLLGRLPIIGEMFQALTEDLNATERAAAGIVVLTNRVKDLNKEMRETKKTTQQLSSALERFERLNRQRFRSAREIQEMQELEADLQRRLGTTATGFNLVVEARTQIEQNEAEIQGLGQEVSRLIKTELDKNPTVSFSDLINSSALTDEMKANLPLLYETYARTLVEGFEDAAPIVQKAILDMLKVDPDAFRGAANQTLRADEGGSLTLTSTRDTVVRDWATDEVTIVQIPIEFEFQFEKDETPEEMFERAVGAGFTGTIEDLLEVAEGVFSTRQVETSNIFGIAGPIAAVAEAMGELGNIGTPEEFFDFLKELREMDLSSLSETELANLQRTQPEFFSLLNLPTTERGIANLFERGGLNAVREFAMFSDRLAKNTEIEFQPVVSLKFEDDFIGPQRDIIKTADEVREEFLDSIVIAMLEAEDPIEQLLEFIRNGFGGVSGDIIASLRFEDFLTDAFSFEALNRSIFDNIEDTNKILELAQKDITQISQDELNFLATRYPELLTQFRNGTFDALAFEETARARRAEMIADEKRVIEDRYRFERGAIIARLGLERDASDQMIQAELDRLFLIGEITEAQKNSLEASKEQARISLGQLDAIHAIATAERNITEEIRQRYKVQLDLLTAQQNAIKDAEKMRKLQDDSANIARRSIEATRIGAVGSVEARFNQQQINREIEQMNRSLQDQLQTAQLEAQQKILEDSQQKALENVTQRLAVATENLLEPAATIARELTEDSNTEVITPPPPPIPRGGGTSNSIMDALEQGVRIAEG